MDAANNRKVLDLIFTSIISEGGDGDAAWLCRFTALGDLMRQIKDYDAENNTGWELQVHDGFLLWGKDQEWATITDSEEIFNGQPSWVVLKIRY
jgi:hypothetical protein